MPAKIRMCARVHAQSLMYARVCAGACTRRWYTCVSCFMCMCARTGGRPLSLSPFFAACISPALSAPFTPFRSRRSSPSLTLSFFLSLFSLSSLSFSPSLAVHFFLVSADEDRSLARRREDEEWKMRGVEGEKKRRVVAGDGRDGKREATTARARGESGEPRGSIGGHRPPQKSAHYHPRLVRRVDGGDDARFINIRRRTLNSSSSLMKIDIEILLAGLTLIYVPVRCIVDQILRSFLFLKSNCFLQKTPRNA